MDQTGPFPGREHTEKRAAGRGPARRWQRAVQYRLLNQPLPGEHRTASQPSPVMLAHPVIAGYHSSPSARNALAYAAGMARCLGRPLLIVYIAPLRVYWEPFSGQVISTPQDPEALERWLLSELDQVADPTGLQVHVRARQGSAVRELLSMASLFRADALIIGAPRHFWHRMRGSVPSRLARHANCPVVVVP